MTITPAAPPAPADRVKQLLSQGKTTQQAAELTGWPRQRVVALVNAISGWLVDPKTDTVYNPDDPGRLPRLPAGTDPEPIDVPVAPKSAVTVRKGSVDELLAHAAGLDDKTVARNLAKAVEAIGGLREAVRTVSQRLAAEQARQEKIRVTLGTIEVLEKQLADARAEAKRLGVKRKAAGAASKTAASATASASGGPSPKDIRAWAASAGVECSPNGRVPAGVREQYDRAHGGEA